jgi:hypothetical protein
LLSLVVVSAAPLSTFKWRLKDVRLPITSLGMGNHVTALESSKDQFD